MLLHKESFKESVLIKRHDRKIRYDKFIQFKNEENLSLSTQFLNLLLGRANILAYLFEGLKDYLSDTSDILVLIFNPPSKIISLWELNLSGCSIGFL